MIRVAICDENNKTLEKLENLIKDTLGNEVSVSTHDNVFSLITYVCDERKGKLDAVYIDINAGQKGGIVAAESLQKEYPNIKIIFLSDDIERAKDIFRINPIYFLTRPYEEDYVKDSLYKIIQMVDEDSAELLTIGNPESKKGDSVVLLKDIYYIESQKRVINIHYYDGFSTYYCKLDEVEKKLKKNFLRTHQSFIVNLDKVKKLVNDGLLLYGGTIVPISRSRYKDVVGTVSRYLNIGEEA
ncbi:MAG: LytTR family DNA-binding domain-containing protein [Butyrivibrio crossotus]|nr:LytTR family DNA-binding domain-containing protein [Butyrivibrio crossotus]